MRWFYDQLRQIFRIVRRFGYRIFRPRRQGYKLVEKDERRPILAFISNEQIKDYARQVLSIPGKSKDYIGIAADSYQRQSDDPMILAYYLPQFHPTPENNQWWGRGVTEWNNVSRAVPQYVGHYQPRLPGELGHYDLRIIDNIARQAELAKDHGIYGFAYYFYWFDGKRLLDQPLDAFLNNSQIDFPFCLCWANESWTRRFDGNSGEVLVHQSETVDSYQMFIDSVIPYMKDRRYIQVAGRPLLIIYRPSLIPNCRATLSFWRSRLQKNGIENPYIMGVRENAFDVDLLELGFDAQSEFHPGTIFKYCRNITQEIDFMRMDFAGSVFDYTDLVTNKRYLSFQAKKLHRAVMPMWDNTPRRNNAPMIFHGSSPVLYKDWLTNVLAETRNNTELDAPFVFINAWNEWGESAYLEPDQRYGYAYLRATREAIENVRPFPKQVS